MTARVVHVEDIFLETYSGIFFNTTYTFKIIENKVLTERIPSSHVPGEPSHNAVLLSEKKTCCQTRHGRNYKIVLLIFKLICQPPFLQFSDVLSP